MTTSTPLHAAGVRAADATATRSAVGRKLLLALVVVAFLGVSGKSFYDQRHLAEPVVLGPGVTAVKTLGDYAESLRGTANDINLYVLEGNAPGGTVLVFGGTHAEEPAGRLAAWLLVENAVLDRGRLIVALSANRSASMVTRPGAAYPPEFTIPTTWGGQRFRMGDRWTNPLDQWPDPEVYIHSPSGQYLAYVDIRNLNRAFPGRANGTLTERTTFAFMELIRREQVDIAIDLHEAELQYPVISTIVTHQKGQDMATMVSMTLTDLEGFKIGTEFSPLNLHGLSHREIGDHSKAVSLLFEAPEPFLDATRGRTNADVLLTGKDEFVMKAGKKGLLFETIDEHGWPIAKRVGRHTSSVAQTLQTWTEDHPDRALVARDIPRYAEVVKNGVGFYLREPARSPAARVVYE
jgi:predicted deacylase